MEMITKVCKRCGGEKPLWEFKVDNRNQDGIHDFCKICYGENKVLIKINEGQKRILRKKEKERKRCENEKLKKNRKTKLIEKKNKNILQQILDDERMICKIERKELIEKKKIFLAEKTKIKQTLYEKFKIERKLEIKRIQQKTDDKLSTLLIAARRIDRNKYASEKRKRDSLFNLSCNIRSLIRSSFKNKGFKKNSKTAEILSCSFEEFKIYINNQFEDWMNWNNHGVYTGERKQSWQLDHIIPISSAKTIEDVIRLNHYSNYQPLDSYINLMIKKNKMQGEFSYFDS
jgi:hypothetical protein